MGCLEAFGIFGDDDADDDLKSPDPMAHRKRVPQLCNSCSNVVWLLAAACTLTSLLGPRHSGGDHALEPVQCSGEDADYQEGEHAHDVECGLRDEEEADEGDLAFRADDDP